MMHERPNGLGVEHTVDIAAPAEAAWRTIVDIARWGEWNPLYMRAQGAFTVGSTLGMTIALEGMKPQHARATVLRVEEGRLIEYEIVNLGGLVRAFRYIEIEETGENACRITNGEIMSGLLGRLLARVVGEKVRKGLQAMNEALKARLEG
jgi:hypothetical protein